MEQPLQTELTGQTGQLVYANTIGDVPDDFTRYCNRCGQRMDLDGTIPGTGMANCLICRNGHRFHRKCPENTEKNPLKCKSCESENIMFCNSWRRYFYNLPNPTGGKKSRKPRTHKKRNRRTNHKKRNNKRTHKI